MLQAKFYCLILCMFVITACENQLPEPSSGEVLYGKVGYVIDGDTFYFSNSQGKQKVKIAFIDAPEMKQEHGFASYEALRQKIHYQDVKLKIENTGKSYWEASVWVKDENINHWMLTEGLAWVAQNINHPELIELAQKAKDQKKGLWAATAPIQPWKFKP